MLIFFVEKIRDGKLRQFIAVGGQLGSQSKQDLLQVGVADIIEPADVLRLSEVKQCSLVCKRPSVFQNGINGKNPGNASGQKAEAKNGSSRERPILLRIETKAGHGAGKPVAKLIEEGTDVYSFLFWQLGMKP